MNNDLRKRLLVIWLLTLVMAIGTIVFVLVQRKAAANAANATSTTATTETTTVAPWLVYP